MTTIVRVKRSQVQAAQLLVKLAGGEDKVEPIIARIANAAPSDRPGTAQLTTA